MTERRHKVHKAPITPFVWACLLGFGFICLSCVAIVLWELSK